MAVRSSSTVSSRSPEANSSTLGGVGERAEVAGLRVVHRHVGLAQQGRAAPRWPPAARRCRCWSWSGPHARRRHQGSPSAARSVGGEGGHLASSVRRRAAAANSSPPRRTTRSARPGATALEPGPDVAQHGVAGLVAEAVVDLLEPVEVEQQQGHGRPGSRRGEAPAPSGTGRGGCPAGELVGERQFAAVGQAGDLAEGERRGGRGPRRRWRRPARRRSGAGGGCGRRRAAPSARRSPPAAGSPAGPTRAGAARWAGAAQPGVKAMSTTPATQTPSMGPPEA